MEEYVRSQPFGAILYSQWAVPKQSIAGTYSDLRLLSLSANKGDTAIFRADATNGVWWQLVYEPDGGLYPWKFVGGPTISVATGSNDSCNSAAFVTITNGPSLVVPAAGDYLVRIQTQPNAPSIAGSYAQSKIYVGANGFGFAAIVTLAGGDNTTIFTEAVATGVAASGTITIEYSISAGTVNFANRQIIAQPFRIG